MDMYTFFSYKIFRAGPSGDDSLPPSRFDIKKSFFVVVDVVVELLFLLPIYREK
jgi:hypothetical protein